MPKIAYTVDNLDSVPEELKQFYVEDKEAGNGYHLDTEKKLVPSSRLGEFRDKNIELQKQNEELTKKFADVDPQEYHKLKTGKVEELDEKVRDRTKAFADENNELKSKLEQQTSHYQSSLLETAISMAASQHGVRPEATVDVINRARANFRFVDGKPVAWDVNKNEVVYDTDGVSIVTPDRWVGRLVKAAPHFFQPSTGGNSPGGKNAVTSKPLPKTSIESFRAGLAGMGFTDDSDE